MTECTTDDECPIGFYCGSDGTCTADCFQNGDGCDSGESCNNDGKCEPTSDANTCPSVDIELGKVTPTVILLVDQSGSMSAGFGGPTRYGAVVTALVDMTNGVVSQLDIDVKFGLTLYTADNGNATPPCPRLQTVAPALANEGPIRTLLNGNGPADDTPTAESIASVTATFPPDDGNPRVIVLATDGDPDSCTDPDSNGTQPPRDASELATQNAFTAGIQTYVLSVGDDTTASHLQRLANAGQGQDLATGTTPYYVANSPAELSAAFGAIIGGIRDCRIPVANGTVDLSRADEGIVVLNGMTLAFGSDWTMPDGQTLELLAGACSTFLNDPDVALEAQFPCGVIIE